MQAELQQRFEAIEEQRRTVKSRACALTPAQLTFKPSADAWSIQQIVEHLVLSDETVGHAQEASAVQPEAAMFRVCRELFAAL